MVVFFFFSSRRRHTRCYRDWSSDVCSSDLPDSRWMLPGTAHTLGIVRSAVAGVLLAAGEGSRFGRPKALVELDGQTLAERGVTLLRAGGTDPVLIVTGAAQVDLGPEHQARTVRSEEHTAELQSR